MTLTGVRPAAATNLIAALHPPSHAGRVNGGDQRLVVEKEEEMARKTWATECRDLAEFFISDEVISHNHHGRVDTLASVIQDAIEDWLNANPPSSEATQKQQGEKDANLQQRAAGDADHVEPCPARADAPAL